MTMKFFPALAVIAALTASAGAEAQRRTQVDVFDAARAGRILSLREIERRVMPAMNGAQYLGVDFDMESGIYTLKFLRNGNVIWVDVDGRSGQIIGRSDR